MVQVPTYAGHSIGPREMGPNGPMPFPSHGALECPVPAMASKPVRCIEARRRVLVDPALRELQSDAAKRHQNRRSNDRYRGVVSVESTHREQGRYGQGTFAYGAQLRERVRGFGVVAYVAALCIIGAGEHDRVLHVERQFRVLQHPLLPRAWKPAGCNRRFVAPRPWRVLVVGRLLQVDVLGRPTELSTRPGVSYCALSSMLLVERCSWRCA